MVTTTTSPSSHLPTSFIQQHTSNHNHKQRHCSLLFFILFFLCIQSCSCNEQHQPRRPWLSGIQTPLPLLSKTRISHDTHRYRFSLKPALLTKDDKQNNESNNDDDDETDNTLGITTCSCMLVSSPSNPSVVRPYTPISSPNTKGYFELLVKKYPRGVMGGEFDKLKVGDSLLFWQIPKNIKVQYPFGSPRLIIMLAAGTGITPMFQALLSLFGDSGSAQNRKTNQQTKVIVLYGSRTKEDIYLRSEMENMKKKYPDRLEIVYCLSDQHQLQKTAEKNKGGEDSSTVFYHSRIDKDAIVRICKENMGGGGDANDDDCCVWVCGPPSFYEDLCGPREEEDLTGVLKDLGFKKNRVVKF